jgi:hypothetical protein
MHNIKWQVTNYLLTITNEPISLIILITSWFISKHFFPPFRINEYHYGNVSDIRSRRPTIARLAHLLIIALLYSSFNVVVVIIIVVADVAYVGGSVGLLLLLLFVSP